MFSRASAMLAGLAAGVLLALAAASGGDPPDSHLAPIVNAGARNVIAGQYIVVFWPTDRRVTARPGASRETAAARSEITRRLAASLGGQIGHVYGTALIGFSAKLPPKALDALRALPDVAYIEADQRTHLDTIELNPPTGLDRIDRRLPPLDHRFTYGQTGAGVNAYVIDTGIRATNVDFGNRVTGGVNLIMDGLTTDDCFHHGTHVAGILGGTVYGVAKKVSLHPVRDTGCNGQVDDSTTIAGLDWVAANAVHPAVANLDSVTLNLSPAMDAAAQGVIASGVTLVNSSDNFSVDSCTISPTHLPAVIAVGSMDPLTDKIAPGSGIGACIDLFAPGVDILSDWNTSDTATMLDTGTSMAAPHVAGVAALYLQNHPMATPAQVWAAIHHADNVAATPGWKGIGGLPANTANEMLHWGSLKDGTNDGDPHLVTVDGKHFNFQGAGEYVYLADNGLMIQTRETPVPTASAFLGPDPYDGVASCVSLNTAVAAKVGAHRVTFEPNVSGVPDPSGMQLRVDGVLTTLGAQPLNFGGGARVARSPIGKGIEIDFPGGTYLIVTSKWWKSQKRWFLNVDVFRSTAEAGLMGPIAPGSWLPALPNGSSVGAMPAGMAQRYAVLYQSFGDAWRVSNATSLFDYKPGTSTATFTHAGWPAKSAPCKVPQDPAPPAKPMDPKAAEKLCDAIDERLAHADCVFDVTITGAPEFVESYAETARLIAAGTITTVSDSVAAGRGIAFTATVAPLTSDSTVVPAGNVQFSIGGAKAGNSVKLDKNGQARWLAAEADVHGREVVAEFTPGPGSAFLPSSGTDDARRGTL